MKTHRSLSLILPVVVLAIVGCGGGGDDDEAPASAAADAASTASLSKDELIEQGDEICAKSHEVVEKTSESSVNIEDAAVWASGIYSRMVERLQRLGEPEETEGYSELMAAARELLLTENEVDIAYEAQERKTMDAAEVKAASALVSFKDAAEDYGFEECGQGPSALSPAARESAGI